MASVPTLISDTGQHRVDVDDKILPAAVDVAAVEPDVGTADKTVARAQFTFADSQRLKRKADYHLIPLFILAYLIKNIDGNMISYVKTMNSGTEYNIITQLHMTTDQYAYLATAFTVSFALFEVPMNLFIKKATPRLQFARIISGWSVIVACTAACQNAAGIYVCRFLLGLAEAGLWSGIIYHINCWYRPDEVATRLALLTMLGQFSGIIDALLAYGFTFVSAHSPVAGWRWCFIICGLLGLIVSGLIFFLLPDWPDSPPSRRQFLSQEEGAFMASRLPPGAASSHDLNFDWLAIKEELKSPLLYGFSFINFFANTGTTGVAFWLPTITAGMGLTSGASSQLLNIPPAVIFVVASILVGLFLDRTVRIPKFAPLITGLVGLIGCFIGLIFATSSGARYTLILLAYMFNAMEFVSVWPLRAQTIRGSSSSAFMFAFSNTVANLPGLYTAQIFQSKYAPHYVIPYSVCIIFFVLSLLTTLFTWYHMYDIEKQTRRVAHLRRKAGKDSNAVIADDIEVR